MRAHGAPARDPLNRPETNLELQKMLWANIAELRLADAARANERRRKSEGRVLVWGRHGRWPSPPSLRHRPACWSR